MKSFSCHPIRSAADGNGGRQTLAREGAVNQTRITNALCA